jgi:hypothetical protein
MLFSSSSERRSLRNASSLDVTVYKIMAAVSRRVKKNFLEFIAALGGRIAFVPFSKAG